MAYVLGYLYADGSLEDAPYLRGKYLRVTSTDKSTIVKIRAWMNSRHKIVVLKPTLRNPGKTRYFLRIGSHELYDDLSSLGLYPNKSLTLGFPNVPSEFISDFIRGYFDGDGCVYLEVAKGISKNKIVKRLRVIFTSGSEAFLNGLYKTLNTVLPLVGGRVFFESGSRCFRLTYSTSDSVILFSFMYKFCPRSLYLRRKYMIFSKYFLLRPHKIDINVESILNGAMSE